MYKILFFFCLFSLNSYSQSKEIDKDPKSQHILDKLSAKMKALKSFEVEFSSNTKNAATGAVESNIGKGCVKGNKFYASYGETTIISNGIKTWTVVKEDKSIYQTDVSDSKESESLNPKKLMTIWESGFKNEFLKEDVLNGVKVSVINLYPKQPKKVNYHTVILYISKTDLELKKAVLKTRDGGIMTYILNNMIENPEVEDTRFVIDLKKFPGYQVVKD